MFATALLMCKVDEKDVDLIRAVEAGATPLGIKKLLVAHIHNQDPLPAPLVGLVEPPPPPRPPELDEAVTRLAAALPGIEVEGVVRAGPPEYVLAQLVDEFAVDLFIMGRNPAQGTTPGWGSASRKLLRLTTCSALVIPRGAALDLSSVVVGLDFSQYSTMALAVACQVSSHVKAIYQFDAKVPAAGGMKEEPFRQQVEQRAREHLDKDILPWLPRGAAPELIIHPGGKVAEALFEHAGTKPIIMGSRGLTPLAAMLLGSSADRVAGRSPGPVLIVRKKGNHMGLLAGLFHRS